MVLGVLECLLDWIWCPRAGAIPPNSFQRKDQDPQVHPKRVDREPAWWDMGGHSRHCGTQTVFLVATHSPRLWCVKHGKVQITYQPQITMWILQNGGCQRPRLCGHGGRFACGFGSFLRSSGPGRRPWGRTRPQNVYPATNNAGLFIQMSVQISKRLSVSLIRYLQYFKHICRHLVYKHPMVGITRNM